MTITTTANKAVATGNGVTTVWPFTFLIPEVGDMTVTLVLRSSGNPTVVSPTLYSITGLGVHAGGSVTYPLSGSPLSALYDIVIERTLTETQETDLQNQGAVYPADIEDALDYLTMLVQQLQDQINRSIVFSVADTVTVELAPATARANLFLGFNASGDPVAVDGLTAGTTVSAAMIPVVTAPTTAAALAALGIPGSLLDLLIPAGVIWDYAAGGTAPAGFLYAYGLPCTALYPTYRARLITDGSPFGTNGVDPLMPDGRAAVLAGKSNMGGVDNGLLAGATVLGAFLGTQTKVLVTTNLPPYTPAGTVPLSVTSNDNLMRGGVLGSATGGGSQTTVSGGTLGIETSTGTGVLAGTPQGGTSTAFSIVQPTLVLNKIVKVH